LIGPAGVFELTRRAYPHQEITGFHGEVYADPSRSTFRVLELISGLQGLTLTPKGQKKKSYMTQVTNNTLSYGIRNLIVRRQSRVMVKNNGSWMSMQRVFFKNPQFVGKFGSMTQLGGDFVFGPGTSDLEYYFGCLGTHGYTRPGLYLCITDAEHGRS